MIPEHSKLELSRHEALAWFDYNNQKERKRDGQREEEKGGKKKGGRKVRREGGREGL